MMTCADAALQAGQPLVYWRIGRTVETPYDVPDQPMAGEMDPFFFVTRTKNFIPHEYPCRTAFAAERRGIRPEPNHDFEPAENVLPFASERLDRSGFWFRPTHIATWARTRIASEGGIARFRLTTPGGAVLFANGAAAGWLAPYTRNFDDSTEIDVDLAAGTTDIDIYFDDLAERDTRHFISLEWLSGTPVTALMPYDAAPDTVAAVEATLAAMHFDRPAYTEGPVQVLFPAPLPAATATVRVEGDFMSHERLDLVRELPPGAATLDLGDAATLPADFRHFRVTLEMDGFAAARTLGVEIAHGSSGAAPAILAERIAETLDTVATRAEPDTVAALARLATGRTGPETEAMIARALGPVVACWDCADFALVPLLWSRIAFADGLGEAIKTEIDAAILGYRYWMDEPGNDVQWYFSENHALLFHTAAYLAGHHFPDATFVRSGRKGAEQCAVGAARVRAWLDHFEAWEMAEFNSAPYFPIDLKGLTALQALAPDADIAARAGAGIARLIEIVANSAHRGVLTGAQGRSYEHTLRASRSLELSAIARLLWGAGSYGTRFHALPQLALCLRDHGLELPDLKARAVLEDGEQVWSFRQGEGGFAALTHAKTRDWALGTAAAYRWFDWGYQETVLHARIGDEAQAQAVINQPGEVIHSGYGRPSFWGGSASIPRVHQYRGLAVCVFDGVAPQPDFTHALFPIAAFDAVHIEGNVAVGASGNGRLVIVASGPLQVIETGPSAGSELRLPGRAARWIVRTLSSTEPPAAIAAQFAGLAATGDTRGVLTMADPIYGTVVCQPDGRIEAEGITIDPATWTVAGERRVR
ncbi:hypothetical protein RDV64_11360 [Acuticoccus sp. MNP-M23]|uniref:hypothetical protein n=1 Tax=Acuticoccus sp. MNP-M23 TaxID=3072793 RepID=UPI002814BA37|nr:hypothetical protein [Acuticoccus sp. MNP-M23]WMS44940.1 hypothetical protein RDV64_11360 [Acuticoccus sp. MNP-M23]